MELSITAILPAPRTELNQLWEEGECITELEGDIGVLIDAIKQGIAVAVSDGSFQDQWGATAWTIKGSSAVNCLTGEGLTPGNPQDQSAYRSELFGIWGMVASIYQLTTEHKISSGQVLVACDGLSALKKAK